MRAAAVAGVVPSAPAPAPAAFPGAAGCVGLGYGVAVAVGALVLVSAVALASYLCVLTKAGAARAAVLRARDQSRAAAPVPTRVVVTGLDGAAIDALYPEYAHVAGADGDGDEGAGACAICLGEFAAGDSLRRGPGCGHRLHACCAERWLRVSATCPVCRDSPVPSLAAHAR